MASLAICLHCRPAAAQDIDRDCRPRCNQLVRTVAAAQAEFDRREQSIDQRITSLQHRLRGASTVQKAAIMRQIRALLLLEGAIDSRALRRAQAQLDSCRRREPVRPMAASELRAQLLGVATITLSGPGSYLNGPFTVTLGNRTTVLATLSEDRCFIRNFGVAPLNARGPAGGGMSPGVDVIQEMPLPTGHYHPVSRDADLEPMTVTLAFDPNLPFGRLTVPSVPITFSTSTRAGSCAGAANLPNGEFLLAGVVAAIPTPDPRLSGKTMCITLRGGFQPSP